MKTILITGINGFLGSHLAKTLSNDYNIIGLEYSLNNLFRISECNYNVYSAQDDIPEAIFTEQTIDIIIHTATFYGRNNEDFIKLFNSNLYSPFNLLDKAIHHGCKLFVNTDTVLDRFVSTYALTKRQFQEWLYLRKNGIKVINMQLEHFYGPGASPTNFITTMINKLKNNELQIDLTLGEQQRDFIYIDDVVNAYLTVIEKQDLIVAPYTSFQVCTNQLISVKKLMIVLKDLTESSSMLNFGAVPYRKNELMHSNTDNTALCAFGWSPKNTLKEGLNLTSQNS
jgi:nucleoside-diphosphate-sugar epimerase